MHLIFSSTLSAHHNFTVQNVRASFGGGGGGGGGGGEGGGTNHVHNIDSFPVIDTKSCLNQKFLLIFLTCELLTASRSVWEGDGRRHIPLPHPPLGIK